MKRNGNNRAMMASKTQIPQGWRQVRLGDVAEVDTGGTPNRSRPEYWDGQIPWMASGQINQRRVMTTVERITWEGLKNSNAKPFPSGTVMVAMNGQGATRGKACVLGIEASCNQSLAAICSRQQTENGFLFHVLDSAYHLLRSLTGDGRAGLNLELIRGFSFLLPPLPEQRAIAAVLDSIDDAIEGAEAVIAATEQLRGSLLHQLLTRGVPGWHTAWKDVTGLGTMPADWEVVRLGEVSETITSGSRAWSRYFRPNGAFFVRSQNIVGGKIDHSDAIWVEPPLDSEAERTRIHEGDLLISITGEPGKATVADRNLGQAFVSQHVALVRLRDRRLSYFTGRFLQGRTGQDQFGRMAYGQTRPGLNLFNVSVIKIAVPTLQEQQVIAGLLDGVDVAIAEAKRERDGLGLLKESTADALLTGRVRVGKLMNEQDSMSDLSEATLWDARQVTARGFEPIAALNQPLFLPGLMKSIAASRWLMKSIAALNQPLFLPGLMKSIAALNQPLFLPGLMKSIAALNQPLFLPGLMKSIAALNQPLFLPGLMKSIAALNQPG